MCLTINLQADNKLIAPLAIDCNFMCFALPSTAIEVYVLSRTYIPNGNDVRKLGIAIYSLDIDLGQGFRNIPLNSAYFDSGFYQIEQNENQMWRWTDGKARLSPALWEKASGYSILRFTGSFIDHEATTLRTARPPRHTLSPGD